MILRLPHVSVLFLFAFLVACKPTSDIRPDPILTSSALLTTYSNATLKAIKPDTDSLAINAADYRLRVYRLTYRTTLEDHSQTVASGIVLVPDQPTKPGKARPVMSYQHGTAFTEAEAPSGQNWANASFSYPLYYALHGYIVVCPDYIGYGTSSSLAHRYEHRQTLAQATVDMLLAADEFFVKDTVARAPQTVLVGYSEGGYATMAAQRLIEEQYATQIRLVGACAGAGPFTAASLFNHVTQQETAGGVLNQIYAWQTLTYNRVYNLGKPASYYFKPPYDAQIAQSLTNARSIPISFHQLCTDAFRADVKNSSSAFSKTLANNELADWGPQSPTLLIHGDRDEVFPLFLSQQALTRLREHGAKNAQLMIVKGGYHISTSVAFTYKSLAWCDQVLRN